MLNNINYKNRSLLYDFRGSNYKTGKKDNEKCWKRYLVNERKY